MTVLFVAGLLVAGWAEQRGNPLWAGSAGVSIVADGGQSGGNLEGKEVRLGIGGSVLAAVTTSNGATGSYNSAHDSYTPIGGAVPLVNMKLGIREMKLIALYTITMPVAFLALVGLAVVAPPALAGLTTNDGPHGFSEIMVAYISSLTNNGQNFAGLSANSWFYNITTGIAMMVGRFALAIVALATAGLFAAQVRRPMSYGTLPTDSLTFAVVLTGTVLIVGGLSYLPALALGPVLEHLKMLAG